MFFVYVLAISWLLAGFHVVKEVLFILIASIKCRMIRKCQKDGCPFRSYCPYTEVSEAERMKILSKINSLCDETDQKSP